MKDISAQIKALALEAGFHQAGITLLRHADGGRKALSEWTRSGRHGSMKYLEEFERRREDFFKNFQAARSVIVLGVNYYAGEHPEPGAMKGRVARYAWGLDYHQIIRQKHLLLIEKIRSVLGVPLRAESCVDIQPVPEKWMGRQAGIGFFGKNTLVLSRQYGPWMFLSEIITDLDLEEDAPDTGDCGTCSKCQTRCPTGALNQDYEMDARLCIAYLTIEHKGVIPRELRPQIKDWVFGCDECLEVCPFTSKSKITGWPEFQPSSGAGPDLNLDSLFEIRSNAEYEKKFSGTALLRAGRKQMLRNACVVLGNSGRPEAIPYLKKGLADPAWLVRLHAAWALGRLATPETLALLREVLENEEDPRVREEVLSALKSAS